MRRSARAIETSVGLSNAQLFLLEQIAADGPLTVAQLGRRLHVRANTISMTVAKLVDGGLATRSVSSDDRRRVAIAITAAGRRLLRRAPRPPATRLLAALDSLPRRELQTLARALTSLVRAMRLDAEPARVLFEDEDAGAAPVARTTARVNVTALLLGLLGAAAVPLLV
jgi:DNA-binding MarR family transcriptional regulator